MSDNHWIAQLLLDCETDVCGHPSGEEFHKAANKVQQMAAEIEALLHTLRESASARERLQADNAKFMADYKTQNDEIVRLQAEIKRLEKEGWRSCKETTAMAEMQTKDDDQKATQGPYVPGQERSGKSPERKEGPRTAKLCHCEGDCKGHFNCRIVWNDEALAREGLAPDKGECTHPNAHENFGQMVCLDCQQHWSLEEWDALRRAYVCTRCGAQYPEPHRRNDC